MELDLPLDTLRRRTHIIISLLILFSLLPAELYLVYIMVNIILFKSAVCIDLACFYQLPCGIYFVPNAYPEGF